MYNTELLNSFAAVCSVVTAQNEVPVDFHVANKPPHLLCKTVLSTLLDLIGLYLLLHFLNISLLVLRIHYTPRQF